MAHESFGPWLSFVPRFIARAAAGAGQVKTQRVPGCRRAADRRWHIALARLMHIKA
jgi:hypothetical protein